MSGRVVVQVVNIMPYPDTRIRGSEDTAGWIELPAQALGEDAVPRFEVEAVKVGEVLVAGEPGQAYRLDVEAERVARRWGVPKPKPGVLYLVEQEVAEAMPDRPDLVFPRGPVYWGPPWYPPDEDGPPVPVRSVEGYTALGTVVSEGWRERLLRLWGRNE